MLRHAFRVPPRRAPWRCPQQPRRQTNHQRSRLLSNVVSRLCDEAKPGQILISPRVLSKVENAVKVEPVGEFELKGIRRPLAAYNVVAATLSKV
jgi:hypothetical protein